MDDQLILHGNLGEIRFPDLLLKISDRQETGVLEIARNKQKGSVYFQDGKIVFAKSNDPDERLGELFLRQNKITYRHLTECFEKVGPGMRLGTVLVLQGYITPNDLYHGVVDQVKEILFQLFTWNEGEFDFRSGKLPTVEVITLNISTPDLILQGIQRIDRWSWVRKAIVSFDAVFRKREGWVNAAKRMTMTPALKAIVDLLDVPRTVEEILQLSPLGNFETCKILWALRSAAIAEHILAAPLSADVQATVEIPQPARPVQETVAEKTPPIPVQEAPKEESTARMLLQELARKTEEAAIVTEAEPVAAVEPSASITAEPMTPTPTVELSFSDLADLADSAAEVSLLSFPVVESWEDNVARDVKDFNEKHRYLFEMLRLELGKGVSGFLTKILRKSSTKYPLVLDGLHVNEYGEFNESSLVANIKGNLVEQYRVAFDYLLREERDVMGSLLDKRIISGIEAGLKRIEQRQARGRV